MRRKVTVLAAVLGIVGGAFGVVSRVAYADKPLTEWVCTHGPSSYYFYDLSREDVKFYERDLGYDCQVVARYHYTH